MKHYLQWLPLNIGYAGALALAVYTGWYFLQVAIVLLTLLMAITSPLAFTHARQKNFAEALASRWGTLPDKIYDFLMLATLFTVSWYFTFWLYLMHCVCLYVAEDMYKARRNQLILDAQEWMNS
jgi:hypothetical protein